MGNFGHWIRTIKLAQISQKECDVLLNRAMDLGINFVDTAD